jgi:hypothetical protein
MPRKSRSRKRIEKPAPIGPKKLEMVSIKLGGDGREEFKDAMLAAAKAGVDAFPKSLERMKARFRDRDPKSIMATVAMYALQRGVGPGGVSQASSMGIDQFQVEWLQAVMLMIPEAEWGGKPLTADVVQAVFDELPTLAQTFLFRRLLAADPRNERDRTLSSLQEHIRLHTQAVRNWAYYKDVIAITKDLHAPLDADFTAKLGFSVTDLVEIIATIVKEFERRANEHWDVLKRILRGRTPRELLTLYKQNVPTAIKDVDSAMARLPPEIPAEGVASWIMQHRDLLLADRATFTADEVAAISGRTSDVVEKVLRLIARSPGDLATANPDFLFLDNPIWTAPVIEGPNNFFIPLPQVAISHVNAIVRSLAETAGLTEALERRRARYLETKTEELLRQALPLATITAGAKWEVAGEQGETDLLVVLDRVVLIVEAKSHRLTPEALRGAPDRMRRHVQDLVVNPSKQSARLEAFIRAAKAGDGPALDLTTRLGIDPGSVDNIIRLSVTLEDFSVLSASVAEFKELGWVAEDHSLAPSMLVSDLGYITEILDNPLLLLHYLRERERLQKTFELVGDELDFLGLYLGSFFNLAGVEGHKGKFSPSGMSEPVDRYFDSRNEGIILPKPQAELSAFYRATIDKLADRRPPGWTTIGMSLLSSADPAEQQKVVSGLNKLRRVVRRHFSDPKHTSSLIIIPPAADGPLIAIYLFPEALRSNLKANMERMASQALVDEGRAVCIAFGRSIDRWEEPYEALLVAQS